MTYSRRKLKMIEEVAETGVSSVIEGIEFDQRRAMIVVRAFNGLKYSNKKRFMAMKLEDIVSFSESLVKE